VKLIICDIDGTIIDSPAQKLPSERFVAAVQAIRSTHYVTCATGRVVSWARPFLEAAHFTAPCIIAGGTAIVNPNTYELLYEHPLPPEQFDNIKEILKSYPDSKVLFNDFTEEEFLEGGWDLSRLLQADHCYVMEVSRVTYERADELIAKFQQLPDVTAVKISSPIPERTNVQLLHKQSTKEHAIAWVQQKLGVSKEDIIGIGDGHNDFHIFNAVGTKMAVNNAVPELKDKADQVIGDVKDDAVAVYLESLG